MRKLVMVFGWSLFLMQPAAAQESGAQQMPEMGPPPEMAQIQHRLGDWTGEFHFRMTPEEEFSTSLLTMEVISILDGAAQSTHLEGQLMGMPFEGLVLLAFNRNTGRWQSVWIDNLGAFPQLSEGTLEGDSMTLEGRDVYQGRELLMRDTMKRVSDAELNWNMQVSYDNGATWFTSMKAVYRKLD